MKVNLDKFEIYWLLESCFRGSHLRSNTILRFVDEWYDMFPPQQRKDMYDWILRDVYGGKFVPEPRLCGTDKVFMARYNPCNQYRVTVSDGKQTQTVDAFELDGRYWINSTRFCAEEYIKKIEKIS